MDSRLFFVLGDLAANLVGGAVIGWLVWLMVGTGWNMWLVMVVMMAVGMLLSIFIWIPFSIFFGAMEVMAPLMLTGMLSGMVVGMKAAMQLMSGGQALVVGAVCGLASLVFVWVMNNSLRGPQTIR